VSISEEGVIPPIANPCTKRKRESRDSETDPAV